MCEKAELIHNPKSTWDIIFNTSEVFLYKKGSMGMCTKTNKLSTVFLIRIRTMMKYRKKAHLFFNIYLFEIKIIYHIHEKNVIILGQEFVFLLGQERKIFFKCSLSIKKMKS